MKPNRIKINRERKTGKEQYFTNADVVDSCINFARPFISVQHTLVEPCSGNGSFLDGIKRAGLDNKVFACDLDPKRKDIQQLNSLEYDFGSSVGHNLFVITNPPFGRANSLSVKFFNKLADSAEYIAFLVPKSWRKWSIQNRLNHQFHLVLDKEMPANSFHAPNGKLYDTGILKTVFQIWQRRKTLRLKIQIEDRKYFWKVAPKDADIAFVAFGYSTGRVERDFPRRKNNVKLFLKVSSKKVIEALERVNIKQFTENTAYTAVISMEEMRYLLNEYFDRN